MELYLIRHGQCYDARDYYNETKKTTDPPLTEMGKSQAQALAERLSNVKFDAIYSSDLVRAMETAQYLQAATHAELIQTEAFREINMGVMNQHRWNEYPEEFSKWSQHTEDLPYPGGENGMDVWKRCRAAIDMIVSKDYERAAIVSHGGAIRSMLCGLMDIPQEKRFLFGYPIENCSISVIKYIDGKSYIHSVNTITLKGD